jgi:acetyl/propionyl-CoA carboxylase alpha subunit
MAETRERMCAAAVALGELMQYRSAGTVEFILDDTSPTLDFYFLELNARIQVEHPITEVIRPGLDLVELMIKQGLRPDRSLPKEELQQDNCAAFEGHAIEVRVYCENPKQDFRPCPGRLQVVEWGDIGERGRIETWVSVRLCLEDSANVDWYTCDAPLRPHDCQAHCLWRDSARGD